MVELVDTLGLEPSALRCAGSSPVPGNYHLYYELGFYRFDLMFVHKK